MENTSGLSKGELRRRRQAEHAAREQARLEAGDTRNAEQRRADEEAAQAKRRRRGSKRAAPGSLRWAEERGGLIGGYETDDTYCPD